jgi:ATP-dependent exoDNAse (exonuclease V) beta subunit
MIEGNLLIRASAGTGKTFSLATRFIRLMLFDKVAPERIVALTFSRAAAQEIYSALLKRLWTAAQSPEGAKRECSNLIGGFSDSKKAEIEKLNIDWSPKTFAELLRKVVASQHIGSIATLDSFILRFVGSFPIEMGFQNALEVLDPVGEGEAVDCAAKSILGSQEENEEFKKAFRAARGGKFSRTCARILSGMMEDEGWRAFILEHPECKNWTAQSMAQALGIEDFQGFCSETDTKSWGYINSIDDRTAKNWLGKFCKYLANVKNGDNPFPSGRIIAVEFSKAVALHKNEPYVEHKKDNGDSETCEYPQEVFNAAYDDLQCLVNAYLYRKLMIVEAKIKLFSIIEKEYDLSTRRAGKLTFQDFTDVAKDNSKIEIENLRFRFDSKLDHWALDEFQDTSEVQWACLRDLVESAASGGSTQSRSVIAVGDLKQSIYTWRGGNDGPFKEMMGWPWFGTDENGIPYGRIENSKISYRYEKRIADFINRVFGEKHLKDNVLIPNHCKAAVERWLSDDCWLEHIPDSNADGKPKDRDYVKVVCAEKKSEEEKEEKNEELLSLLFEEISAVWKARDAAKSSETIGILVRRNGDGTEIAEYLRKKGLPVVWEGMNSVSDVPVVQGVLQLLKLAIHPNDSFAWVAVNTLLPIRKIVLPGFETPVAVSAKVAELLSQQGLTRVLKDFCGTLCREENGLDELSRIKLRALVRLGVDYERRRSSDYGVDGFARYVAALGKRESSTSSNAIRILSIHRSKGLTLDRVFVPIIEGEKSSIVEPMQKVALFGKNKSWILPRLSCEILNFNEEMKNVYEEQCKAKLLESLRLYYVALTRSRKVLYVLFKDEKSSSSLFRDIIKSAVSSYEIKEGTAGRILFEDGVVPAFTSSNDKDSSLQKCDWGNLEQANKLKRRSPTGAQQFSFGSGINLSVSDVFFTESYDLSVKHGITAHEEYQKIEWLDEETLKNLPPAFRETFEKPSPDASVWRERRYELYIDDCWETGQFDRVVFTGSDENRIAVIYDFKTNAKKAKETDDDFADRMRKRYSAQMDSYKKALSLLTKIPLERIKCKLLLESTGQIVIIG